MKKITLTFSLFAALLNFSGAKAQTTPYTLQVFEDAVYYNMFTNVTEPDTPNTPVPAGAIRNSNSSYGKKITAEQIAAFGNKLTLNVEASSLCDDFDRIGNVNLVFVPKGATAYDYKTVKRIEIGRFITPFMVPDGTLKVPYTYDVDNLLPIFRDAQLSQEFDFWVELEIYGYQGSATQGGAAADYPTLCGSRNDVYKGSLEFVSTTDATLEVGDEEYFQELSYNFQLKNYVLATDTNNEGTDVLNSTVRSIKFTLDKAVTNAKFYLITSNHGSNSGGEEYNRRYHYVYLDGVRKLLYKPGETTCEPYRQYNTRVNGIYGASAMTPAQWQSFSNWCPGAKIPTRVIDLGDLAAGEHTFKIEVPNAQFAAGQGYFPMSLYVQAYSQTLGTDKFAVKNFSVSPNPVNDIATITSNGLTVKNVDVVNILGQVVLKAKADKVDLSSLQAGVYIVKVLFDNNQTATQKIIKK